MKAKTALVTMIVFITLFSAIPVSAKRDFPCPPTSLEVWKTITSVTIDGEQVTVSGTIYIQNDVTNPAWVWKIDEAIEAKGKGQGWTQLERVRLVDEDPRYILAPGDTATLDYEITFTKGNFKAYRNVVYVLLDNHPTGDRWFKYRLSFDIP